MEKIASIQALRGISVLMVCSLHFLGPYNQNSPEWMKSVAFIGHHGVTMFFVISGYVLPLALSRVDYSLAAFPRFMLKRLVRLEPPYLITIAVAVIFNIAASRTPGFQGRPLDVDVIQIAAHIGYIAPLVGKPWILGVFWSLLVEVQFYILIGLTYALFRKYPVAWIIVIALPSVFAESWQYLPYHLPVFLIGTTAFAWRVGMIRNREALALGVALAVFLALGRSSQHAAFSLVAAAYILWAKPKSRALLFAGTISYSLYLIHIPFGVKALHLVERVSDSALLAGAIAFACALVGGTVLWFVVERPAMRIASGIAYRSAGNLTGAVPNGEEGQRAVPPHAEAQREAP